MKSHSWLLEALIRDSAVQCSVPPREIERDLRTISHRVESEGLSFLTISLPAYDSALLRALADGRLPSNGIPGFRSSAGLPCLFRGFLRLVFDVSGRLLDDPSVTAVACLHQICLTFKKVEAQCSDARVAAAMRQYIEVDRSLPDVPLWDERLSTTERGVTAPSLKTLSRLSTLLYRDAFLPLDRKIFEGEPLGAKHGPGATAERVKGNDKFRWSQWTQRLDEVFSPDLYLHALENCGGQDQSPLHVPFETVAPEHETPVRVIHVPKTMKTPRVIAIEPVVMQYMQQGLLDGMTKGIKSSMMGGSTLFDDQTVNANRALRGSKDGHNATLDLSEASDRVAFWLVDALIRPGFPRLMGALAASRSHQARVPSPRALRGPGVGSRSGPIHGPGKPGSRFKPECGTRVGGRSLRKHPVVGDPGCLPESRSPRCSCCPNTGVHVRIPAPAGVRPILQCHGCQEVGGGSSRSIHGIQSVDRGLCDGTTVPLRKFASMGSAVCFPVEAVVFTTIAIAGVLDSRNLPLNVRSVRSILADVTVFGDDIIVPVDTAPLVALYLEAYGLKVNRRKSFWTGRFRESCGTDAFQGEEVTPTYLKTLVWGDRKSLRWLAQWVEFSNGLYMRGFWETARIIREKLSHSGFSIPMVSETSPAIGYHNIRGTYEWHSWDRNLHKPIVRAYRYRSKKVHDPLDGVAALRKCLTGPRLGVEILTGSPTVLSDPKHLLETSERSSSVSTKKRWTAAF